MSVRRSPAAQPATALVTIAFAIAATLSAGVVAALSSGPAATPVARATSAPSTPTSTPTPTPSPSATPTPTPMPTPTPRQSRRAAPPPTVTPPLWPTPAPNCGRPAPAPIRESLHVTITVRTVRPDTQTYVEVCVEMTDGDGEPGVYRVDWGDGFQDRVGRGEGTCMPAPSPTGSPTPHPRRPARVTTSFHHAWRRPGRYTVTASVMSDIGCPRPGTRLEMTTATTTVGIADGRRTSNGPALPSVFDLDASERFGEPRRFDVEAGGTDLDGWINRIVVAWGDGQVYTEVSHGCDDGGGAYYPQSAYVSADEPGDDHKYAKAGTYHIRVTVYSAGCDGKDVQRVTRTLTVRVR